MVCLFVCPINTHCPLTHPSHFSSWSEAGRIFPFSLNLNKSCECITFLYSPNTMIKSEEETLISPRRYQEPWVLVIKRKTWSLHLPCLMLKKCLHCEKWTCRGDNEVPGELGTLQRYPATPDTFSWIIGNNIIKSTRNNYLIFSSAIYHLALFYFHLRVQIFCCRNDSTGQFWTGEGKNNWMEYDCHSFFSILLRVQNEWITHLKKKKRKKKIWTFKIIF